MGHTHKCRVGNKYEVTQIDQYRIFEFDPLADEFNWKNVKTSQVREIKVVPRATYIEVKCKFF